MLVSINADHPEPRKIGRAVEALRAGKVIAYPTDTSYGLGCSILDKRAVDALYAMKRLEPSQPLAFVCADIAQVAKYAIVENHVYRVLRHFLPGPYCFILTATREVPRAVQSKHKTVGVRVPNHEVPRALVRELGHPIISSTALDPNTGEPLIDPDEIDDVYKGLGLVLDAGAGGLVPSTVVDLTGAAPSVVREGAGPVDAFLR